MKFIQFALDLLVYAMLAYLFYLGMDFIFGEKHSLEVVAQNEAECRKCGGQVIITIREKE